ncbi:MAG: HDOD domain-containing protein, partial [Planctomycetaceae bacterium]|nr:HDOD domain-containing protein [Planctomycetaceae bacterium]
MSAVSTPSCSTPVWVGRQPILTADKRLVAYEILYRCFAQESAQFTDGNHATSTVLLNLFSELGLEHVVDDRVAFVNFTREFITGEHPLPQCPKQLIVEVLEDIEPDPEVIAGIRRLRRQGFRIALDDVVYHPDLEPLLEHASLVKVDLSLIPQTEWASHVQQFRKWPVKLLAEKVETLEEFQHCRSLGFDLFQGYFFSKPELLEGRKLDSNQTVLLRILSVINSPQVEIQSLARTVEADPALCLKILRYVNSSHFGIRRTVESLQQACVLLGLDTLRTITSLLLLVGNNNVPQQAARTALLRAWMCRNLGQNNSKVNPQSVFTVGLLSMLDVLLGQPL